MPDDFAVPQDQQINVKMNADPSDVYRAISDVELRAQQASQSVSAMSSNVLNQIAQMQAAGLQVPNQMPMSPMTQYNAMQSAMYAGTTMPFSPQNMLARDMYQSQIMAMGPSSGFGPAMTTPMGTATINPFQAPGAPSYQLPVAQMQQFGAPGQPGDPTRSRMFFGTGAGSLFNAARQAAFPAVSGLLGYGTGYGFGNDNLEDLMQRNVERQRQYLAENVFTVGSTIGSFGASTAAWSGGQAATGALAGRLFGVGGIARGALGLGGGLGASLIADAAYGHLENRERAYMEGAKDLRDYTAPYVRGSRPGGGMSYKETLGMERDLMHQVGRDNFFNAEDYRTLINMAGETGMFQMTGSKEQALKAVENLGKSVKTLFSLGVKSREQLQAIDVALNQFGVNASTDPTKMANLFQTFAVTAQSAGMSTGQLAQAVAPAAQAAMAQGLGPMAGGMMAAQNFGIAGGLFRSGALGAFDKAYFGGVEGYGNTLTQAQLTMMRSPMGQMMMGGLFAPGSDTMSKLMKGQTLGTMDVLGSMAGHAANPLGYIGMQARLPELTQNLGPQLQTATIGMYVQAYKQMGLPVGEDGRIDPNNFMGFLMSPQIGLPQNEALALVKMLTNAQGAATDIRRSVRDQGINMRMEQLRKPSLRRMFEKWQEHTIDPFAVAMQTGGRELALDATDTGARLFGRMLGRDVKDYQELVTGTRVFDVGENADLLDADKRVAAQVKQRKLLQNLGFAREMSLPSKEEQIASDTDRAIENKLGTDESFRAGVVSALNKAGIDVNDATVTQLLKRGRGSEREVADVRNASDTFRRMQDRVSTGDAETKQAVDRVLLAQYRGMQERDKNLITGMNRFDALNDSAKQAMSSRVASDTKANQKYLTGVTSDMDSAAAEERFYQNVADADAKYQGKKVSEIRGDQELAAALGMDAKAAAAGLREAGGLTAARGLNEKGRVLNQLDAAMQGKDIGLDRAGAAASVEELGERLKKARGGSALGHWARVGAIGAATGAGAWGGAATGGWAGSALGAGLTLVTGGAAAPLAPVLAAAGTAGGALVGGTLGLAAGVMANAGYESHDLNHGLNKILGGKAVEAGTALRIGSDAALRQLVQGTRSYAELVDKLRATKLQAPEIDRLLKSANIDEQGYDSVKVFDMLSNRQKAAIGASDMSDTQRTDIQDMITEINRGDAGDYLTRTFRSLEQVEAFKANTNYKLNSAQSDKLRGLFGQGIVDQLNTGSQADLRTAAEAIQRKGLGGENFKAVQALLGRDLAGSFGAGDDAALIGKAGFDVDVFRGATAEERTALLRSALVEPVAGKHSTEQDTAKYGTSILSPEMLAAQENALNKQLEVAKAYEKLAADFSEDNTSKIVVALDKMTSSIGGPGGEASEGTFAGAVKLFKDAVDTFKTQQPRLAIPTGSPTDNSGKAPMTAAHVPVAAPGPGQPAQPPRRQGQKS